MFVFYYLCHTESYTIKLNNMKNKQLLKLVTSYDYISLVTPNGRFTTGRSGEKCSGAMAAHPTAFKAICAHLDTLTKSGTNYGDAMKTLTDEKILSKLWPEWNAERPVLSPGDLVTLKPNWQTLKKGIYAGDATVASVKRTTAQLTFPNGIQMGFDISEILKK